MAKKVIIIGSGLAGYMLAKEIRKHSSDIDLTIITSDLGRFYSKPQLSTALAQSKSASDLTVSSAEKMAEELSAEIITNTLVTAIDPSKRLVFAEADNESWQYDRLVLATGAETIKPRLEGDAADKVTSINSLKDYSTFRDDLNPTDKIAVIGEGLVGCEFAHDFSRAGHMVSVIGLAAHPLPRLLPEVCARAVESAMAEEGVQWYLNEKVISVDLVKNSLKVTTEKNTVLEVDKVVSAIGLRPHLSLAKLASLKTNQGICVDEYLQTSDENIYALGDVAEINAKVRLYVAPLLQSARSLAKTLCGDKTAVKFPLMPIVVKTAVCPVAVLLPDNADDGQWQIEAEGKNITAKFINKDGKLTGFALTGDKVKLRVALMKQMA